MLLLYFFKFLFEVLIFSILILSIFIFYSIFMRLFIYIYIYFLFQKNLVFLICFIIKIISNSKPPGPIIKIGQSKIGNSSQIIFIAFFSSSRCTGLLRFIYQPEQTEGPKQTEQRCRRKAISLSQTAIAICLTFLHPILMCRVTYWAPVGML